MLDGGGGTKVVMVPFRNGRMNGGRMSGERENDVAKKMLGVNARRDRKVRKQGVIARCEHARCEHKM